MNVWNSTESTWISELGLWYKPYSERETWSYFEREVWRGFHDMGCAVIKGSKVSGKEDEEKDEILDDISEFKISINDTNSKVTCNDGVNSRVGTGVSSKVNASQDAVSEKTFKYGSVWVTYDVIPKPDPPSYTLLDEPIILSSFPCPCDVHSICPNERGQAWTCDMFSSEITLIDNIGCVLQSVTCRWLVDDISLADDKHQSPFLLCTKKKTVMDLRCPKSVFKINHRPTSICYTGQDKLVIGTKRKITLYNHKGAVVKNNLWQDTGIIWPWRMSACPVTGNIAAIDMDIEKYGGMGKPNVLVMSSSLKTIFRYRGRGSVSGIHGSFQPSDLAFDGYGNLVIVDCDSRSLELISGEGKHLKTLHTDKGHIQAVGVQMPPRIPQESDRGRYSENVIWISVYYPDDEEELDQIKLFRYYSS